MIYLGSWAGWQGEVCWFEEPNQSPEYKSQGPFPTPQTPFKNSPRNCPDTNSQHQKSCNCCGFDSHDLPPARFSLCGSDTNSVSGESNLAEADSHKYGLPHSYFLRVKAKTIVVSFQESNGFFGLGSYLENGPYFNKGRKSCQQNPVRLYECQSGVSLELMRMSTGRLLAICLAAKHREVPCLMYLLVVTEPKTAKDWAERVGIMKVPISWYMEQNKEHRSFLLG